MTSLKEIPKSSAFSIPTTTTICYPQLDEDTENSEVASNRGKLPLLPPVLGTRRRRTTTNVKQKEPAVVARRNARERKRVKLVNDGFTRLRKHVPTDPKNKKLSKVKTLRSAIEYIRHLQQLLTQANKLPISTEQDHEAAASNTNWIPGEFVSTEFSRHVERLAASAMLTALCVDDTQKNLLETRSLNCTLYKCLSSLLVRKLIQVKHLHFKF